MRRRRSKTPSCIICILDISSRELEEREGEKCIDHDNMSMLIIRGKSMSLGVWSTSLDNRTKGDIYSSYWTGFFFLIRKVLWIEWFKERERACAREREREKSRVDRLSPDWERDREKRKRRRRWTMLFMYIVKTNIDDMHTHTHTRCMNSELF